MLTSIFIVLSSLFSTPTHAQGEDPSRFCDVLDCSKPMHEISQAYRAGNKNFTNHDLTAYSGACYHISPIYDPNYAHYGVKTFRREGNQLLVNGFFGFFYNEDPYAQNTAAEIEEDLSHRYTPNAGEIHEDYAALNFYTDTTAINYWYRSSPDESKLYLISRQSGTNPNWYAYYFCRLDKRAQ